MWSFFQSSPTPTGDIPSSDSNVKTTEYAFEGTAYAPSSISYSTPATTPATNHGTISSGIQSTVLSCSISSCTNSACQARMTTCTTYNQHRRDGQETTWRIQGWPDFNSSWVSREAEEGDWTTSTTTKPSTTNFSNSISFSRHVTTQCINRSSSFSSLSFGSTSWIKSSTSYSTSTFTQSTPSISFLSRPVRPTNGLSLSLEALGQETDGHPGQDQHIDDLGPYRNTLHHPGIRVGFNWGVVHAQRHLRISTVLDQLLAVILNQFAFMQLHHPPRNPSRLFRPPANPRDGNFVTNLIVQIRLRWPHRIRVPVVVATRWRLDDRMSGRADDEACWRVTGAAVRVGSSLMRTMPVDEHGKYSPDVWFLCHPVDGSRRVPVASLQLALDMKWPENDELRRYTSMNCQGSWWRGSWQRNEGLKMSRSMHRVRTGKGWRSRFPVDVGLKERKETGQLV